ncbi:hypothetical protein ACFE04_012973 [Oxalis oulophora]
MAAATSSLTSPLYTWLVAACMSVTCDQTSSTSTKLSSSSKNKFLRKSVKCCSSSSGKKNMLCGSLSSSSSSTSTIQGLMSSCLAFEPCSDFYNNTNSFLGGADNAFFGSINLSLNRKQQPQRRLNSSIRAGIITSVSTPVID